MWAKYLACFEETVTFFCQAILLSYRIRKSSSRNLTNTGAQHAANICMPGVSSMWETPPSYQRQVVKRINQTNPVKLGVLRVLWQFNNYSTIQNHWGLKRAENTLKKTKRENFRPHVTISLTVCLLFVTLVGVCWWPIGSGSQRIPVLYQSYLVELSPCILYVESNGRVELGLLIIF